jgi:hypothetical protein
LGFGGRVVASLLAMTSGSSQIRTSNSKLGVIARLDRAIQYSVALAVVLLSIRQRAECRPVTVGSLVNLNGC